MYYDLLTRIKNAELARKEGFQMPFSKFDFEIAKILADKGFLETASKRNVGKKVYLDVKLKYQGKSPALTDFKIISKPSRRFYIGYKDLKPVKQNFGVGILSTPQGIATNSIARKNKVGGEYLFQVW